jgi:endonuclease G, mitochondrial
MLSRQERAKRLKAMLARIAHDRDQDLETLAKGVAIEEGVGVDVESARARSGLKKLATGQEAAEDEVDGLEAIIMPKERPVAFVVDGGWEPIRAPWTFLNDAPVRARLAPLLASIGRIELPTHPMLPYGGTGFVVGDGLIMTNRHVAKIFTQGLGVRALRFKSGDAGIDFVRERDTPEEDRSAYVDVVGVEMIHPYWDMALLRVRGLPNNRASLRLSTRAPEDLVNRNVAVIGYPGRDERNDLDVQDRIFEKTYYVKRFQPGKVRERLTKQSFENVVSAMTHDSSTLGGNSGSAVIDIDTGEVLGLHFAGEYLAANYAVPMHGLAGDPRVVDAGLNFVGSLPPTDLTDAAWARADDELAHSTRTTSTRRSNVSTSRAGTMTWTIPLEITVSLDDVRRLAGTGGDTEAFPLQVPIIHDDLESRRGYESSFLGVDVEPPALTKDGEAVAAKLEDGSHELKYHRFSVWMHKRRRLALFAASNVDWRADRRLVDGRKPTRKELTGLPDKAIEKWVNDPRIPERHQLPDVFYTKDQGAFDKGHLVRRDDVAYGDDFDDIQRGNGDTYHVTNCTPQVLTFNRSGSGDDEDNWGDLEKLVQTETKREKACIFSGPVLADDDRFFHGKDDHGKVSVQIPRSFWKIIVTKGASGKPEAFGFVLEQDLSKVKTHEELVVPRHWQRHLRSIKEIEGLLGGYVSLASLVPFDQATTEEALRVGRKL